jgi:hypothetical protein
LVDAGVARFVLAADRLPAAACRPLAGDAAVRLSLRRCGRLCGRLPKISVGSRSSLIARTSSRTRGQDHGPT